MWSSGQKLDSGSYGEVKIGCYFNTDSQTFDNDYVMKSPTKDRGIIKEPYKEIYVHTCLPKNKHVNHIDYILSDEDSDIILVSKRKMSNFRTLLIKEIEDNSITIGKVQKYLYQCLEAVKVIHDNGFVHADIKPGNFLVDSDSECLSIIDFGLSFLYLSESDSPKTLVITDPYRAPEVDIYISNKYGRAIDIWSLGIMALAMSRGDIISGINKEERTKFIINSYGVVPMVVDLETLPDNFQNEKIINDLNDLLVNMPDEFINLLLGMLQLNPKLRYNINQCLNHEFFNLYNFNKNIECIPTQVTGICTNSLNVNSVEVLEHYNYTPNPELMNLNYKRSIIIENINDVIFKFISSGLEQNYIIMDCIWLLDYYSTIDHEYINNINEDEEYKILAIAIVLITIYTYEYIIDLQIIFGTYNILPYRIESRRWEIINMCNGKIRVHPLLSLQYWLSNMELEQKQYMSTYLLILMSYSDIYIKYYTDSRDVITSLLDMVLGANIYYKDLILKIINDNDDKILIKMKYNLISKLKLESYT